MRYAVLLTVIGNLMQHADSGGHLTSGHGIQKRWYPTTRYGSPHAPLTDVNTLHMQVPPAALRYMLPATRAGSKVFHTQLEQTVT